MMGWERWQDRRNHIFASISSSFFLFQSLVWGLSHRIQITKINTQVEFTYFHLFFLCFFEWVFGLRPSFSRVLVFVRPWQILTRLVMTTSVRFTGVLAQGKMNILFIFHRHFFLLNLIDHEVDLKWSVRNPRKHCAIDHLSSQGYNFEGVFVF